MGLRDFLKGLIVPEAVGDQTIALQERAYREAQQLYPDAEPHEWLAQAWLSRMAANGKDVSTELFQRAAFTETMQFACVPPPDNARALGLFFVYKEQPALVARYAKFRNEFDRLMGPVHAASQEGRLENLYAEFNPSLAAGVVTQQAVAPEENDLAGPYDPEHLIGHTAGNACSRDDEAIIFSELTAAATNGLSRYLERARNDPAPATEKRLQIAGGVEGYRSGVLLLEGAIHLAQRDTSERSACTRSLDAALSLFKEAAEQLKLKVANPDPPWMRLHFVGMLEGHAAAMKDFAECTARIESRTLDQGAHFHPDCSRQSTIEAFAKQLKVPTGVLLDQLKAAGVLAGSPHDELTEEGKSRLLAHLRATSGRSREHRQK